jgi:hypothetical protein
MAVAPSASASMMVSARYAPSANSEPWARLITSITPTISMKPSAISANSRPSVRPLKI